MSNMPVRYIVVHYSATYSHNNVTAADIDKMHKARGFNKIGYHYFYRRDGTEEVGRREEEIGAHVKGFNTGSIGLCWAGGLETATGPNVGVKNITPAQETALIRRIKMLKEKWPNAEVVGHRDLGPTQCPGFDVKPWWKQIEQGTKAVPVVPITPPATPKVVTTFFDFLRKLFGK